MSFETTQLLLTGALVSITAFYALQTHRTVKTMQKSTDEEWRPRVGIYIIASEKSNSIAHIMIKNYGKAAAYDIKFKLIDDVEHNLGDIKKLSDYRIFKKGIKNIFPGQEQRQYLMSVFGKDENFFNQPLKVKVSYKSEAGKPYNEEHYLDFTSLPEIASFSKGIDNLVKELEKTRKALENLARRFK